MARVGKKIAEGLRDAIDGRFTVRLPHRDMPLSAIEVGTLARLVDALESLKDASEITKDGLASDHMHNAARQIRAAMRIVGGA